MKPKNTTANHAAPADGIVESTHLLGDGAVAFHRIGVLHHPKKDESIALAGKIEGFLRTLGIDEIWHESAWDADVVARHLPAVDLLITLGGDGTLLRAAHGCFPWCAHA
ncbi:MAG: hypothetical protein R2867_35540 [Caldilineaceae bacterium]